MSVLVLSPHRDDAAFSCGLLLRHLATANVPIHIANVCTISDYAPYAGLPIEPDPIEAITHLRSEEDDAFLQSLQSLAKGSPGALQQSDLAWKDAPLRRSLAVEKVLTESSVDANEVNQLAQVFRSIPAASVVLAPLSLGGHIDHRLVREAAIIVWPQHQLLFYEDLPYACRISAEERTRQTQAALPWPCAAVQTPPMSTNEKRSSALCYGSQIAPAVADEMEDYGAAMGWTERLYGNESALPMLAALISNRTTKRKKDS